jgi:hypothetical protein
MMMVVKWEDIRQASSNRLGLIEDINAYTNEQNERI